MKISELTLKQLDAWVARAEETPFVMRNGFPCREEEFDPEIHCHESSTKEWKCWTRLQYSSEWSYGGPIIQRASIALMQATDKLWAAEKWTGEPETREDTFVMAYGDTPLIAAMRCYVESKFGDDVDEPAPK